MTGKTPTPADMPGAKPNFEKADAPEETDNRNDVRDSRPEDRPEDEARPMIAVVESGKVTHGPMPVSDWPKYERENDL